MCVINSSYAVSGSFFSPRRTLLTTVALSVAVVEQLPAAERQFPHPTEPAAGEVLPPEETQTAAPLQWHAGAHGLPDPLHVAPSRYAHLWMERKIGGTIYSLFFYLFIQSIKITGSCNYLYTLTVNLTATCNFGAYFTAFLLWHNLLLAIAVTNYYGLYYFNSVFGKFASSWGYVFGCPIRKCPSITCIASF